MNKIDLRRIDLNLLVVFDALMAERSVTAAAARLGRTQSAVSHALARLRDQVRDPLLVRSHGRMAASPFAEGLFDDVRTILATIQRVLEPPQEFVPASSTREFRIAVPDVSSSLFPALAERVAREAPGVSLEWAQRDERTLLAVVEGRVDVALVPTATRLPDGIAHAPVRPFRWGSYMRRNHPALRAWGRAAWLKWPHVAVRVGVGMPSPVEQAVGAARETRRVTTWVPQFSAVAPLLARTDLIATLPHLVMVDAIGRFGLRAVEPPLRIEPMQHRLVWSRRLGNEPALRWLRRHVAAAFEAVAAEAETARQG